MSTPITDIKSCVHNRYKIMCNHHNLLLAYPIYVSFFQPPPPGVAPNQAQMAAMHGHTVVGTQQNSNWFSGGGRDGGYSWGF